MLRLLLDVAPDRMALDAMVVAGTALAVAARHPSLTTADHVNERTAHATTAFR